MQKLYFFLFFTFTIQLVALAQVDDERYNYRIQKTKNKINVDGILDENDWKIAQEIGDFFLNRPFDTAFASQQTMIRMTFDDNYLYIGGACVQNKKNYTVASLKRDFDGGSTDVFTINIDTYSDKLNAFHFALSPLNVQREGLIDNSQNISFFWDNKWLSKVTNYDDKWVLEVAIPFSTLRYKVTEGENSWRINFGRLVLESNQISTWVPVPRNFHPANVGFNGKLVWAEKPPKPSRNISLIPYFTSRLGSDFPRDNTSLKPLEKTTANRFGVVGGDAKIAVTSAMNLDLTFNPDFSQVEVDRQVANLSRFELFFPERRQFFLENSDLFDKWGFPTSRPFFSRRIGIAYNPIQKQNVQVPILAGARLSGKIDNKTRIGLINMQTKKLDFDTEKVLPAANYSVATIQRNVLKRSILGGVFVNKQNFLNNLNDAQKIDYQPFNRVAGLEFNYNSADGKWESESYYHHSFTPTNNGGSMAHFLGYRKPTFGARAGYLRVGENYQADVGFVPRRALQNLFTGVDLIKFTPDKFLPQLNSVALGYEGTHTFDLLGKLLDMDLGIGPEIKFDDYSEASLTIRRNYTFLFSPFDPTNAFLNANPDAKKDITALPIGEYTYHRLTASYFSAQKYNFSYSFNFNTGQFFTGKSTGIDVSAAYRFQPYGNFSVNCNYSNIKLPAPYNSAQYWLVGSRLDLSFSRSLFASAFLQFNTQTNNMNLNTRLQWRFRPVSDLFLVYTDNYFAQNIPNYNVNAFSVKNRALVLKLTYWI